MKNTGLIIFAIYFTLVFSAYGKESKIISSNWTTTNLISVIRPDWRPYPKISDREKWNNIPDDINAEIISEAESLIGKPFQPLILTDILNYSRTGNRSDFQNKSFGRRDQLTMLVIAECIENKGRFTEDIANRIWAICEESYWGVPAHLYLQKAKGGLPDVSEPTIDLFAAETASLLASAAFLLEDDLNKLSEQIITRISHEINNRIIQPFTTRNDFWWMGFNRTSSNNWNPWINSNILLTTFLLVNDQNLKINIVEKVLRSLDQYVDPFPEDGGCDEGPSYWGRAGASLFECLELLYLATDGNINHFTHPKIKKIGQYVYKSFIHEDKYANYADAHPVNHLNPSLIYRYGQMIDDDIMMQFGSYLFQRNKSIPKDVFRNPARMLPFLFSFNEIMSYDANAPYLRDNWLPDIQVMFAREKENTHAGFYMSAKAGHNAENHNHNDVGNFILYSDGVPVIVDAGVGNYTAQTFSKDRYKIWSMQSKYHNLPIINQIQQKEGRNFEATNVKYSVKGDKTTFTQDLANAYPPEAFVRSWIRTYELNRKSGVSISDTYVLDEVNFANQWSFISCQEIDITNKGFVIIKSNGIFGDFKEIRLNYPDKLLKVEVEKIPIAQDEGFSYWKNNLVRIVFTAKSKKPVDTIRFSFR